MPLKVNEAERPTTTDLNTSDSASGSVELSSSENELLTPPKRKTLQKKRVHTDYSEEEAEEVMSPKKKIKCPVEEPVLLQKGQILTKTAQAESSDQESA